MAHRRSEATRSQALRAHRKDGRQDEHESAMVVAPDGSAARLENDSVILQTPDGAVVARFKAGCLELVAPDGDLKLSAPHGHVVLSSSMDVKISAARDVLHQSGRRVDLASGEEGASPQVRIEPARVQIESRRIEFRSAATEFVSQEVRMAAQRIHTSAEELLQTVGLYELKAVRIVEKARDAFRDITDLAQDRVGRLRSLVKDVYSMSSRRTLMKSKDDTSIDGKKILLG